METANQKKNRLLGEPYGTATSRLRKILLFDFAQKLNKDICYRCGSRIELLREFSIEHTIAWQSADNPREVFFDISQIAFSHLSCNIGAAYRPTKVYESAAKRQIANTKRKYTDPQRYKRHLEYKRGWYKRKKLEV